MKRVHEIAAISFKLSPVAETSSISSIGLVKIRPYEIFHLYQNKEQTVLLLFSQFHLQ